MYTYLNKPYFCQTSLREAYVLTCKYVSQNAFQATYPRLGFMKSIYEFINKH